MTGDSITEKKKRLHSSIIGIVPRLIGASVGAASICTRRILFGHGADVPKPDPEPKELTPKEKDTKPTEKKRKKKHTKAHPKRLSKKGR